MNKFNSIFGQILQIFSHRDFIRAVRETQAEKGVKGFSCWGQFVAMRSVSWDKRIRCGRYVEAWRPA